MQAKVDALKCLQAETAAVTPPAALKINLGRARIARHAGEGKS